MRSRPLILLSSLALLAAAGSSNAQEALPFRTRNLNPLVAIFGLPAWHVPQSDWELSVTSDVANHYRLSQRGTDRLIADAETIRTGVFLARRLGDRWSVSFELPHYRIYGGVLDDVIDAWHSAFDLPDGGRNNRREGLVRLQMAHAGEIFFDRAERDTGIGDVQLGVTYSIGEFAVVSFGLKVPTGDEALPAGSGGTDYSVSLLRPREVTFANRSAGYYWGFGFARLGEGFAHPFDQREHGYFGVLGGSLRIAPRLGLRVQIDMHSALYRSDLEEIGERAWQGSLGGWWEFGERGVLDFALSEDLEVSTSPDIVVHVNARWQF